MPIAKSVIAIAIFISTASTAATVQDKTKPQQCTASKTTEETGTWREVRHQLKEGKAKCFESKCDITWQEYAEAACKKKIVKRNCVERNVKIVDDKVPC